MPLRLTLRPREKVFINGAVIENGGERSDLLVLNDVVILRQKDILTEATADTPCKKLYFFVQLMYIDAENRPGYQSRFWDLASDIARAAPSAVTSVGEVGDFVTQGDYYKALKAAKHLVQYEKELMDRARQSD